MPARAGSATTSSIGTPSIVSPTARLSSRSSRHDDLRKRLEARENLFRRGARAHHGELLAEVAPAPRVAGRLPTERLRDRAHELPPAREQQAAPWPRLVLARERLEQARLGLWAHSRSLGEAARCRGVSQLVGRAHAERARHVDHAPRADPEVAPETDQIRGELPLELLELLHSAGLDQLAQPRLDAAADAPQVAYAASLDELGDRCRRAADRLGRAPIRAGRVGVRLGELEQRGVRLEPVGDLPVLHLARPAASAPARPRSRSGAPGSPSRR